MIYQKNGARLYYEIRTATTGGSPQRSGEEPTLLFLHGALGSATELDRFAPCFAERDCLLLDLPGHGQSSASSNVSPNASSNVSSSKLSIQSIAQTILEFLQHLKIYSVDIIGYSLGGYIAIEMALLSKPHVRSIISHAMKFYWTDAAIEQAIVAMNWDLLRKNEKRVARLEAMHSAGGAERVLECNRTIIEDFKKKQLSTDDLQNLNVPLLLSVGDRDELVPLSEVLSLYQALGYEKASLAVHANTRHPITTLSSDSFERAARQFWRETI